GAAAGCIYGLIALGFVLIYKATEMVNFAQGDIMMLGGFVAFSLIAHYGLPYWAGALIAICLTAAFGYAPGAGIAWGYDSVGFNTPFTNKTVNLSGLILGEDNVSIIVGTLILCGILFTFFSRTRVGVAMQAASQ